MTDERPAEPDTKALMRAVDEFGDNVGGYGEDTELRRAVEAAARLCAIEYAESRVRAIIEAELAAGIPTKPPHDELAALARLKEEGCVRWAGSG